MRKVEWCFVELGPGRFRLVRIEYAGGGAAMMDLVVEQPNGGLFAALFPGRS